MLSKAVFLHFFPALVAAHTGGSSGASLIAVYGKSRFPTVRHQDKHPRCHFTAVISVITEITYFLDPRVKITLLFETVISLK